MSYRGHSRWLQGAFSMGTDSILSAPWVNTTNFRPPLNSSRGHPWRHTSALYPTTKANNVPLYQCHALLPAPYGQVPMLTFQVPAWIGCLTGPLRSITGPLGLTYKRDLCGSPGRSLRPTTSIFEGSGNKEEDRRSLPRIYRGPRRAHRPLPRLPAKRPAFKNIRIHLAHIQ